MPWHHQHDESDVTPGPIVSGAPFPDPTLETDHRDDEPAVVLTRTSTQFEADILAASLKARGITAATAHGRSWHHVMVFPEDVEAAQALLAADSADNTAGADDAEDAG